MELELEQEVELEEVKWETEWDRTGELELAAEELTMELETGLRREGEEDDRGEEEKLRRNKEYV